MCRQHRPGRKHSSLQQAGNCLDSVCVCVYVLGRGLQDLLAFQRAADRQTGDFTMCTVLGCLREVY